MDITAQLFARAPFNLLSVVAMFLLGTLTLVFSMIAASRLAGSIDFGPAHIVIPKGAALLAVATAVNFIDCGIFLAGPIWFFGLMLLFGLDYKQTRILTEVNWGMNFLWKLLLLAGRL